VFGTLGVLVVGWIVLGLGHKFISQRAPNPKDQYRRQRLLSTLVVVVGGAIVIRLWAKLLPQRATSPMFGTKLNYRSPYASNIKPATEILKSVGQRIHARIHAGRRTAIEKMQRIFMVPPCEVEPVVFMKVTDNWVELTLRYLVDPKKRRAARSYMFDEIFHQMGEHKDIEIASSTMTLTVQQGGEDREANERTAT
jgi:hypothetical protein